MLARRWQRHWVLIRKTSIAAYSTTTRIALDGNNKATILAVETGSTNETTMNLTTKLTTLLINKGCGAERNRVALGHFAAYVQQQWTAMHEEDTTCTHCGQQFLPSMIEEHQEKCESAGSRHAGDMFDYLKDDRALYNRLKNGDYCLQMEPKLEATGESRMNLVLIKGVACNSCRKIFPANQLENHRRWECEYPDVKRTIESGTQRRFGLLALSQGLNPLEDKIQFTSMF